jgi:hypothetical protein
MLPVEVSGGGDELQRPRRLLGDEIGADSGEWRLRVPYTRDEQSIWKAYGDLS